MGARYNEHGLTAKQEVFAREVAKGSTLSDAYRTAYDADNMTNEAIHTGAYKLRKNPQVAHRIMVLEEARVREMERKGASDRDEVTKLAKEFATNDGKPDAIRLRALELWGRTCGAFVDIVEDRRERPAAMVASELERRMAALLEQQGLNASDDDCSAESGSAGSTETVQ